MKTIWGLLLLVIAIVITVVFFPGSDDDVEEPSHTNQDDTPRLTTEQIIQRLLDNDRSKVRETTDVLVAGGAASVDVLVPLLRNEVRDVREYGCNLLGRIGAPSIPALRKLADDPEARVRYHAVSTLGDLGPDAASAVQVLAERLSDDSLEVSCESAWALAALREDAAPAASELAIALNHFDPLMRIYAAGALASIGPKASSATDDLIAALDDVDSAVRRSAAQALAAFGASAAPAVDALLAVVEEDDNVYARICAIGALGSIGAPADSALQKLRESLNDPALRDECAWAIERISGEAVELPDAGDVSTEPSADELSTSADAWVTLGGSPSRNAVSPAKGLPVKWNIDSGENVLWSAPLGEITYGSPVVGRGMIFVGTDNSSPRDPEIDTERGVLLAFDAETGKFRWQDTAAKLGRGIDDFLLPVNCSSPWIGEDRLWYITAQCELRCLDLDGFADGNDGPLTSEERTGEFDADHLWQVDLGGELGVFPHEAANCSVIPVGDVLLVCTSNGVDEAHTNVPAPRAPSFIGVNRHDGRVVWRNVGPGANVLHGQWSSPAVARVHGKSLALFGGGDGVLYGLDPATGREIWRYDGNPPGAEWRPAGGIEGVVFKNAIVACPVVEDGRVYLAMGQDPEHGHGPGRLHAIDPRGRGDVTKSHRMWVYEDVDRVIGQPIVHDGLVYVGDTTGWLHCVDAERGTAVWKHDLLAAVWGGTLVADGKLYVGDEDGTVTVFRPGREKRIASTLSMDSPVYCAPAAVDGVLYIATSRRLWALREGAKSE